MAEPPPDNFGTRRSRPEPGLEERWHFSRSSPDCSGTGRRHTGPGGPPHRRFPDPPVEVTKCAKSSRGRSDGALNGSPPDAVAARDPAVRLGRAVMKEYAREFLFPALAGGGRLSTLSVSGADLMGRTGHMRRPDIAGHGSPENDEHHRTDPVERACSCAGARSGRSPGARPCCRHRWPHHSSTKAEIRTDSNPHAADSGEPPNGWHSRKRVAHRRRSLLATPGPQRPLAASKWQLASVSGECSKSSGPLLNRIRQNGVESSRH